MPRYFFNLEGVEFGADNMGAVLAGPEDARSEAVVTAGEMLREMNGRFWNGPEWRMHVTDEAGATVCDLRISGRSSQD